MKTQKLFKLTLGAVIAILIVTSSAQAQSKDIVGLTVGNDNLSTLVAAVKAGDLVEILQGDGPFTVFAPTNEAFAALQQAH